MYYIQDNGDSTMVTPFDAFKILLPEYQKLLGTDEDMMSGDMWGQLQFFDEDVRGKDGPGKGFQLLDALVKRKKRNK